MEKKITALFLLLLGFVFFSGLVKAETTDRALGNIVISSPAVASNVARGGVLDIAWDTKNRAISNLAFYKRQRNVLFRLTLVEELSCLTGQSCNPQKYVIAYSTSTPRSVNDTYTLKVNQISSTLPLGRYRLGICYLTSANQKLTRSLARARCGLSGVFNIVEKQESINDQLLSPSIQSSLLNNNDNNNNSDQVNMTWEEWCRQHSEYSYCSNLDVSPPLSLKAVISFPVGRGGTLAYDQSSGKTVSVPLTADITGGVAPYTVYQWQDSVEGVLTGSSYAFTKTGSHSLYLTVYDNEFNFAFDQIDFIVRDDDVSPPDLPPDINGSDIKIGINNSFGTNSLAIGSDVKLDWTASAFGTSESKVKIYSCYKYLAGFNPSYCVYVNKTGAELPNSGTYSFKYYDYLLPTPNGCLLTNKLYSFGIMKADTNQTLATSTTFSLTGHMGNGACEATPLSTVLGGININGSANPDPLVFGSDIQISWDPNLVGPSDSKVKFFTCYKNLVVGFNPYVCGYLAGGEVNNSGLVNLKLTPVAQPTNCSLSNKFFTIGLMRSDTQTVLAMSYPFFVTNSATSRICPAVVSARGGLQLASIFKAIEDIFSGLFSRESK